MAPGQTARMLLGSLFSIFALCVSAPVRAQLPLNIEELLVEAATVKLETGTAFRHAEELLPIVTSDNGVVVPILVRRDLEVTEVSTRLRYGFSSELEISGGLRVNRARWQGPIGKGDSDTGQVVDAGVNWLVSPPMKPKNCSKPSRRNYRFATS